MVDTEIPLEAVLSFNLLIHRRMVPLEKSNSSILLQRKTVINELQSRLSGEMPIEKIVDYNFRL